MDKIYIAPTAESVALDDQDIVTASDNNWVGWDTTPN